MAGVLGGPWEGRQGHVLTPPTTPISAFLVTVLGLTFTFHGRCEAASIFYDDLFFIRVRLGLGSIRVSRISAIQVRIWFG